MFDCHWGREVQGVNFSLQNLEEAALILQLYDALVRKYPELRDSSRIGIISPYKAQVSWQRHISLVCLCFVWAQLLTCNLIVIVTVLAVQMMLY